MQKFLASCQYAILLLRKDKLSLPFIVGTTFMVIFAYMASQWTIEDLEKILMDLTAFGLHIFGGIVTILWGTRLFNTFSDENPAIEFELSAPLSRGAWLTSRFIGFSLYLSALGALFFAIWLFMFRIYDFRFFSWNMTWMFICQISGWLSLAALTCFVSTFCRRNTALFTSFSLWVCGLLAPLGTSAEGVNPGENTFLTLFGTVWNFQRFNVVPELIESHSEVLLTLAYAAGLWVFFLGLSCMIVNKRNIYS